VSAVKALVVYDSYFGNTKAVAEAIAEQAKSDGLEVETRFVRDRSAVPSADILFLGSPVRMGSTTGRAKRFVKHLDAGAWSGRPIAVFTTTLHLPDDATQKQRESQEKWDRTAGRKLAELAGSQGLRLAAEPSWVEVEGMRGPVVESGFEQAKRFAHDAIATL
jgi:NAD(P)H dehydrogenase (quinone)